uniref:Uncharacterized protein n=1 Tax=Arundo donax TaxID=35708 RepID=A0A0A8Y0C3_ARUDO
MIQMIVGDQSYNHH